MKQQYHNANLSDQLRVELARLEYRHLQVGQAVQLSNGVNLGTVWQLAPTEVRGCVIADSIDDPRELTILFRGSSMIPTDPSSWTTEWLDTNLPIGRALVANSHQIPEELKLAAHWLDDLLKTNPQARAFVYGHSLGSINAQYAISTCHFQRQVVNAWLYEGSNVYRLLNSAERAAATQMKANIHQYIDPLDLLAVGYTDFSHVIGQLHYVDSVPMPLISQHMWGGYLFDEAGKLSLRSHDDPLVQSLQSITLRLLKSEQITIPANDSQAIVRLRKLIGKAEELREQIRQ